MNGLVVIDGNAILHRAYHALPPLTSPDGTMVNAVYGFVSMLIKIWNDFRPTHIAVAFDRPEPTFRKALYKEYQATRPKMEDNLAAQVDLVHDVVTAFGISIFEAPGFEADDVIGTLCQQIPNPKHQISNGSTLLTILSLSKDNIKIQNSNVQNIDDIVIVTGDRDMLQLVDGRVKVFMPTKGLSEGMVYGEREVVEKMGVSPKQIPDLKALMGDASDNYPGVAGIGPKTAVKLITSYGSIEELYKKVKGKRKKEKGEDKLLEGEEYARLSKYLATIRTDAPVDVRSLAPTPTLDTPPARDKLAALHFPSLIKRLAKSKGEVKEKVVRKNKAGSGESEQLAFV